MRIITFVFCVLGLGAMAPSASGDGREPGSLLVFPCFDSTAGAATVITVTNVNKDHSYDPARRMPEGTIDVEYVYIDGGTCMEFNRVERLSPQDTRTVLASAHSPEQALGYLYVFAKDSVSGEPVTFDWLIGHVQIMDGLMSMQYGTNVFVFRGATEEGEPTDKDEDGVRDLDGLEYEPVADQLVFPRFFGQGVGFESSLVVLNLSGGTQFTTTLDFLIYNDNEVVFSGEYTFKCWALVPLVEISGAFRNDFLEMSDNDDREIWGLPIVETGWFRVDGGIASSAATSIDDPAFLGFLFELLGPFGGADLPFEIGGQENGDLLPRSVLGDV